MDRIQGIVNTRGWVQPAGSHTPPGRWADGLVDVALLDVLRVDSQSHECQISLGGLAEYPEVWFDGLELSRSAHTVDLFHHERFRMRTPNFRMSIPGVVGRLNGHAGTPAPLICAIDADGNVDLYATDGPGHLAFCVARVAPFWEQMQLGRHREVMHDGVRDEQGRLVPVPGMHFEVKRVAGVGVRQVLVPDKVRRNR